jgi:hypothetical protein
MTLNPGVWWRCVGRKLSPEQEKVRKRGKGGGGGGEIVCVCVCMCVFVCLDFVSKLFVSLFELSVWEEHLPSFQVPSDSKTVTIAVYDADFLAGQHV